MSEVKVLYRYETYQDYSEYSSSNTPTQDTWPVKITLEQFTVIRETPMCYVIRLWNGGKDVFVLKGDNGKRYAYSNKKAAYDNLIRRTQKRVMYTQKAYFIASSLLKLALKSENELLSLQHKQTKGYISYQPSVNNRCRKEEDQIGTVELI